MTLVAGIDSSTQSCKVVIRDARSGALVRSGSAPHPPGTEVEPEEWWRALQQALVAAGGLEGVAAVAVAGQQHGMVCLDDDGAVVRPALLWNDTRSAAAAAELVAELPGGARAWAEEAGSVPVASFTVTKLRWLAEHEPENARRTAAVCLPHDWLTWRLGGSSNIAELPTDRGEASGTGYWSPARNAYNRELLRLAFGATPALPRVAAPSEAVGTTPDGVVVGPGTGDNAAAALALDTAAGDVIISIGTSGVACAVTRKPTADASGLVAGFANATGAFLPLTATLNGARVLESMAGVLGVTVDELSALALAAPAGAGGVTLVPFFEGERTPNRPDATATLYGLTLASTGRENIARAAVEGLLCGLADGLTALENVGVEARRVLLIGGGARSAAVREIAGTVFGLPITVPEPGEYVADGAARQAAWVLSGEPDPPHWDPRPAQLYTAPVAPAVRARYREVRDLATAGRQLP